MLAVRQPHRKRPPAAGSTLQYPFQVLPPRNSQPPLRPSHRWTHLERDPKPLDSIQDHKPSSHSNSPWQTHPSSAPPAKPPLPPHPSPPLSRLTQHHPISQSPL